MSWVSAIVVYVIIWWLVLFMVLPFGVKQPDHVEEGHMPGAPESPKLWKKALITSLIAAVLFGGYYWLTESGLITIQRSYSG